MLRFDVAAVAVGVPEAAAMQAKGCKPVGSTFCACECCAGVATAARFAAAGTCADCRAAGAAGRSEAADNAEIAVKVSSASRRCGCCPV